MRLCSELFSKRSLAVWPLAVALAFGAVVSGSGQVAKAQAQAEAEEEDDAWDTRIFRSVIRSLGLRDGSEPGIEYRERSPLVLPPSAELPAPQPANAHRPDWPEDVDVKRAREYRAARNAPRRSVEEESLPETPAQLNRRAGPTRNVPASQRPGLPADRNPVDPLPPSLLGAKGLFGSGGLFGGQKEEYATFTEEPERRRLTDPPAGYRTPSAAQPYGVGKERYQPQAQNPMDTPQMRGEE